MIDLHCHILPGIDDGAQTIEDSLEMARYAVDQGITHILCTPHHNNGKYENSKAQIVPLVAQLQEVLDEKQIPIILLEGQEVRITDFLLDDLRANRLVFTDLSDTYLLLELPSNRIPEYTESICYQLRSLGKVPVIVHPERNAGFIEEPNKLIDFLDMGCLAQLTAPSYVGVFGKKIQKTAKQMVENHLVQMVASDAHGIHKRNFYLKEAYQAIEKDFGIELVQQMQQVAKDLVNGDIVSFPDYQEIKPSRFNWFRQK
ncbi:MAG TPA: tyrosine protein phosphatase [Enterococcus columbae]|nr:tyrosine protein phosphatase [Enterococcus columbae]